MCRVRSRAPTREHPPRRELAPGRAPRGPQRRATCPPSAVAWPRDTRPTCQVAPRDRQTPPAAGICRTASGSQSAPTSEGQADGRPSTPCPRNWREQEAALTPLRDRGAAEVDAALARPEGRGLRPAGATPELTDDAKQKRHQRRHRTLVSRARLSHTSQLKGCMRNERSLRRRGEMLPLTPRRARSRESGCFDTGSGRYPVGPSRNPITWRGGGTVSWRPLTFICMEARRRRPRGCRA
jgi:hypothetical protein